MASNPLLNAAQWAAATSSLLLRLSAFIFLRWIPGHPFPPIVYSLLAVYIPSFYYALTRTSPFNIISDRVYVTERDTSPQDLQDVDPRYVDEPATDAGKELIVEEEIEVEEKDAHAILTLLTGLPSPKGLFWSAVTFLINAALVAMVVDLVWRAHFFHPAHDLSMARVGYVSHDTANILVREPDVSQLPIFASYRSVETPSHLDNSWKSAGSISDLSNLTDFTSTFKLTKLKPDTRYEYSISTNHFGTFTTPPRPGQISDRPEKSNTFTFLHSSCIKPNFPYTPFSHPLSIRGLKHLSALLPTLSAQFMLFLGDFIYIDVPHRKGSTSQHYRQEYRQVYASPDWPAATQNLPWLHVYDDHEIANDWDQSTTPPFHAANDPYTLYHTSVNPPPHRTGGDNSYFSFTQGPASFFLADTRRYRTPSSPFGNSTLLGKPQLSDLLTWLAAPTPPGVRWKFFITSVPFTRNWRFGTEDTWGGYLSERRRILEAMWDVGERGGVGVVILSGDRHEFAATSFPPPPGGKWGQEARAVEFSVSPLSMFYLPVRTYSETPLSFLPSFLSSKSGSLPPPTGGEGEDDYETDICLKYLPDGNSKFSAVSLEAPVPDGAGREGEGQAVLRYRLFVEGKETWRYTLTTPEGGQGHVKGRGKVWDAVWG
ncbi:alkaline phosphatase family protein [Zymoseptoria brevis]|uniref:Alkaline phosphatase family protein n=1 Tax=Zymoseptoria brevis TaxID=1047168 RepID=A0A0F4GC82_9PEZI|nr:alkaline phosphatase family protein [Zymoseptoria brevis]